MSCMGFSKTPKGAWRNITTGVCTKLSKIKSSKSLRRLAAGLDTVVRQRRSALSTYRVRVGRVHQMARPSAARLAPVYVDELYNRRQQQPVQLQVHVEEKKKKKATDYMLAAAAASSSSSVTSGGDGVDQEKMVMMSGVDLRAEMFIRKFKEEKKLERQRSFQEYQEMLFRGI